MIKLKVVRIATEICSVDVATCSIGLLRNFKQTKSLMRPVTNTILLLVLSYLYTKQLAYSHSKEKYIEKINKSLTRQTQCRQTK